MPETNQEMRLHRLGQALSSIDPNVRHAHPQRSEGVPHFRAGCCRGHDPVSCV